MSRRWSNAEGYSDPTAGEALGHITHDEKKARRKARKDKQTTANRRLPSNLLMSLVNTVCDAHGFKRILTKDMVKQYRAAVPQPIVRSNGKDTLWADIDYVALQLGDGPVTYLYVTRTHIFEERKSYREASEERGVRVRLPGDIDKQFEDYLKIMHYTGMQYYISGAAEAYGFGWVREWHKKLIADVNRISGEHLEALRATKAGV